MKLTFSGSFIPILFGNSSPNIKVMNVKSNVITKILTNLTVDGDTLTFLNSITI